MKNKVLFFLTITFLINYLMGVWLYMTREHNSPIVNSFIIPVLYMFVPMVVAILLQKFVYNQPIKKPLGISFRVNRWFVVAWLSPVIYSIAVFGISLLLPGVLYTPNMEGLFEVLQQSMPAGQIEQAKQQLSSLPFHPFWFSIISSLIAGITVNAIAGFGEELGWRGLLLREWEHLGFWKSAIYIGIIWGIWHAPLILQGHNYPQYPLLGVGLMVIWCTLLSPWFSYITLKSNSVIAAAIMHGTLNASAGLSFMLVKSEHDLLIGVTGLAGMLVLFLANIILFVMVRNDNQINFKHELTNAKMG